MLAALTLEPAMIAAIIGKPKHEEKEPDKTAIKDDASAEFEHA